MFKTIIQALIKLYTGAISPFLAPRCRYYPTCSSYAHQAVERHGALRGSWLALCRIGRCHPWSKRAMDDPVPEKE